MALPEMDFRIVGPVEAVEGCNALPLGAGKQRALLAALLLQPNRVVGTERLVELLWGDESPETAHNVLQVYVSQLRKVLEPARRRDEQPRVVVARAGGYALHVDVEHIDVEQFERLARAGRQALSADQLEDALQMFQEALALWRGPALADIVAPFVETERARLEARRLDVMEDRLEAELKLGRHADVVGELESLAAKHPLRDACAGS